MVDLSLPEFTEVIWLSGLTGTDESLAQRASSALEVAQELQPLGVTFNKMTLGNK